MAFPSPARGRARSRTSPSSSGPRLLGPRLLGPRLLTRGLLVGVVAGLSLTVLPGAASAAPTAPTDTAPTDTAPTAPADGTASVQAGSPEEATRLVAEASHQLEVVTEQVNDAQVVLGEQQAAAAAADQAGAAAAARLATLSAQVGQIARSAYTANPSSFTALMTSSSPEDFLAQVSTLDLIAGHTNDLVAEVAQAAQVATGAQAAADTAATAAQQTLDSVTTQQDALQQQISSYQAEYDALTASQQQQVVTAQSGGEVVAPSTVVAPDPDAQTIVDTAMAQRGDPYAWGAGGPDSFDCSGLTSYAYAAAGISLPHSSAAQSQLGTAVSRADLQPGDLVFFYSPVSHVGIYIGNGMMVHAPTSGDVVKVSSVDVSGYVGARRL